MKTHVTKTKASLLVLAICAQVLLSGCATTTSSTSAEDDAKLAKAQKMADRFETRPRGIPR